MAERPRSRDREPQGSRAAGDRHRRRRRARPVPGTAASEPATPGAPGPRRSAPARASRRKPPEGRAESNPRSRDDDDRPATRQPRPRARRDRRPHADHRPTESTSEHETPPAAAGSRDRRPAGAIRRPGAAGSPARHDTVDVDRPVMLDVDAAVGGVRIGPSGSLTFDPAQSRRLSSRGNVVVAGRLTMRPSSAQIVHQIEFVDVDESRFVGGHSAEPSPPMSGCGSSPPACSTPTARPRPRGPI